MPKIIAVDLDGTLATTTTDGSIGTPIKPMVDRILEWHDAGRDVAIFTARGDTQRQEIQAWLKTHGLPALNVTGVKTADMLAFWDNKAVRVETDTGVVCPKCEGFSKKSLNHSANLSRTDC